MAVPYTFGSATTSIPLSQLDSNFATTITLGNTAIQLGNTVTTLNNMTLANVTVSSGNVSVTSVTDSGLTSGRVTYASTGGLLADSANLTFDGTTLTANTIGAFTLGGTIAGGGNQINNVIIGTSTPLAGSFTTLTGSTSVTTPIVKSASSLTLQTNGTTTAITVDTSQNVGIGTSSPANKVQIVSSSSGTSDITTISRFDRASSGTAANGLGGRLEFSAQDNAGSQRTAAFLNWGLASVASGSPTGFLSLSTRGTDPALYINNSGIVTMSAYGAGAATFSAAGVISSVSDETWKIKDGVPVDPDSMLNKLNPGYWYYNDEKKETFGSDRQLGFYAQNVNSAIGPEAAPIPEEGKPWGYYDRSVLAITVMSLQKALATINTQSETINALTARIVALESK